MSASTKILTVLNKIITQMETINGEVTDFHFNVPNNNIKKGFETIDQIRNYPAIRVTSPSLTEIRATDQITYEGAMTVDIYGHVEGTEPLDEVIKLFADIEKALLANPELDSTVWGLMIIHVGMEDFNEKATVLVRVSSMLEYDSST